MILSETVPSVVTWAEIKAHCRLEEDTERISLNSAALACVELFERETGIAAGQRTIEAVYAYDDVLDLSTIQLPKGPVIEITTVENASTTLAAPDYELRRKGHSYYLHMYSGLSAPLTVTYEAGYETVPASIKQAVLIHTETLYRNRGATSAQQQYLLDMGLERMYRAYDSAKSLVG